VPLLDPDYSVRRRLKVGLTIACALAGGVFGLALTRLAKIATEAPPAPLSEYLWNAAWMAALAAIVGPLIVWSSLRRAPLWRTIVEPLVAAVGAACLGLLIAAPMVVMFLPVVALMASFANLSRRYPEPAKLPLGNPVLPRPADRS
jgi:hypothetical protein